MIFTSSALAIRAEMRFKYIYSASLFPLEPIFFSNAKTFIQTPLGVACANRKVTRLHPNITKQFSFSEESTQNQITTYIKDVTYDSVYNAVRYERRNYKKEPQTFYSLDPLVTVHDYNVGVSFTYNKHLENCTITPIPFLSDDEDEAFTQGLFEGDGSFVIRLKSPESFLLLDSDYVYTGRRFGNNVPTESYISDRSSKNNNRTFISEYQFSAGRFVFEEEAINATRIPISLTTFTEKNQVLVFRIFYRLFTQFQLRQKMRSQKKSQRKHLFCSIFNSSDPKSYLDLIQYNILFKRKEMLAKKLK